MRVWPPSPFPSLPRWWSNHLFGCFWNFYSNDVHLQASTILITPYAWKKAKVVERNDICVSKSLSFPAGLLILSLSLIGKNCVCDALNRRHFKTINKWLTCVISVCFPESNGLIIGYLCVFSSLSAQASSRPHFRLHARRRGCAEQLSRSQAKRSIPVHFSSNANLQTLNQLQRAARCSTMTSSGNAKKMLSNKGTPPWVQTNRQRTKTDWPHCSLPKKYYIWSLNISQWKVFHDKEAGLASWPAARGFPTKWVVKLQLHLVASHDCVWTTVHWTGEQKNKTKNPSFLHKSLKLCSLLNSISNAYKVTASALFSLAGAQLAMSLLRLLLLLRAQLCLQRIH